MNSKLRKTLAVVLTDQVSGTIEGMAIEGLLLTRSGSKGVVRA